MVRSRTSSVNPLSSEDLRREEVDITFLIWAVSRSTADLVDAALRPTRLSGDEFAIYSMLASSTSIAPSELARWMAAAPTTVSSYVKRLEARGHIEREQNPEDKRSYRIRLTEEGREAHVRAAALFRSVRDRVHSALGPQEPGVRDALLALRPVLDEIRSTSLLREPVD
jgi:DNA-binding MarR family transcriptional regulator